MLPIAVHLCDLRNVGPAALADFVVLGIESVEQLRSHKPENLYHDLQRLTGIRHDPCVYDVFAAAVHQALTGEARNWWTFTSARKEMQRTRVFPFGG